MMAIASVLYPRHKFDTIEFYFSKIFGSEYDEKVEKIRDILFELLKAYEASKDNSTTKSIVSSKEADANLDEEEFLAFRQRRKNVKVTVMTELDHYLEDDVVIDSKTDFDVLVWWKVNGMKFPTLQAIARDILAIPISTVASESAFSMSGKMLTPHRSCLQPNIIEALLCTQSWFLGYPPGILFIISFVYKLLLIL